MDKNIFEEGPRRGHAAGDTSIEQQASQLASDIKYKARQKMKGTSGSNMSPGQVQQLYRSLLGSSTAPGAVKAIVKKKLFKEQIDPGIVPVSEHVKGSASYVYTKVFLEAEERKFVIKVVDKATGNTSYRKADRAKIAELRANKNIASVEITGRKEPDDAYKGDPKPNYGSKKAKKDYDGDGKIESGTAEYMGSRDKAIKKAMAKEDVEQVDEVVGALARVAAAGAKVAAKGAVKAAPIVAKGAKAVGKGVVKGAKAVNKVGKKVGKGIDMADKATDVALKAKKLEKMEEEFIADAKEEDKKDKKLDVMKGKNEIKINPALGESIRAELDALKAKKVQAQEAAMNQQADERKQEALAQQQAKKDKMMKIRILRNKMMAVRSGTEVNASHEMQGDSIVEADGCAHNHEGEECPVHGEAKCPDGPSAEKGKKKEGEEDPRSMPAKISLAKNKLRAMGLRMSYDMEGEMTEGASNPFQVHFDKDGKEYKSKGTKSAAMKIAKNIAANRKKGPMKYDPYKGTDGRD